MHLDIVHLDQFMKTLTSKLHIIFKYRFVNISGKTYFLFKNCTTLQDINSTDMRILYFNTWFNTTHNHSDFHYDQHIRRPQSISIKQIQFHLENIYNTKQLILPQILFFSHLELNKYFYIPRPIKKEREQKHQEKKQQQLENSVWVL